MLANTTTPITILMTLMASLLFAPLPAADSPLASTIPDAFIGSYIVTKMQDIAQKEYELQRPSTITVAPERLVIALRFPDGQSFTEALLVSKVSSGGQTIVIVSENEATGAGALHGILPNANEQGDTLFLIMAPGDDGNPAPRYVLTITHTQ
ncbi:MAG: hypothetical protein PF961_07750 [Planctomycetota bacterium]|jgi:hypothetical protein|nr:hypothetical protein [Planctomycetota bacterium]